MRSHRPIRVDQAPSPGRRPRSAPQAVAKLARVTQYGHQGTDIVFLAPAVLFQQTVRNAKTANSAARPAEDSQNRQIWPPATANQIGRPPTQIQRSASDCGTIDRCR
jgi:hypothetical protein